MIQPTIESFGQWISLSEAIEIANLVYSGSWTAHLLNRFRWANRMELMKLPLNRAPGLEESQKRTDKRRISAYRRKFELSKAFRWCNTIGPMQQIEFNLNFHWKHFSGRSLQLDACNYARHSDRMAARSARRPSNRHHELASFRAPEKPTGSHFKLNKKLSTISGRSFFDLRFGPMFIGTPETIK